MFLFKVMFAIVTTAGALLFAGCGSSSGMTTGGSLSGTHTTFCSQVGGHNVPCARVVAYGIQAKTGSGKVACYYEHMKAGHMQCYVFRAPWKGTMIVRTYDNRWHVSYIVMPDNTRKRAPLTGYMAQ